MHKLTFYITFFSSGKTSGKASSKIQPSKTQDLKVPAPARGRRGSNTGDAPSRKATAFASEPESNVGHPGKIEVLSCEVKEESMQVCWFKEAKKITPDSFRFVTCAVMVYII